MMRSFLNKLVQPRVLLSLLALSLACNLFLAAVIGGALLGKRLPFFLFARNQIQTIIAELPETRQQEIRSLLRREIVPDLQRSLAEQQQLRRDLASVISAPEVSRETLETSFGAIRQATTAAHKRLQERFIDLILQLPPQERQELASGMRRLVQR